MIKKIALSVLFVVLFSIIFWVAVNLLSDFIFATQARADGEPHKAKLIFNTWIGLSFLLFLFSIFKLRSKH